MAGRHARIVTRGAIVSALAHGMMVQMQTQTPEIDALRARAEHGDVPAQYDLGVLYANGTRVPQEDAEAARWYRLVASRGDAEAQFNLGFRCGAGIGVYQRLRASPHVDQPRAVTNDGR